MPASQGYCSLNGIVYMKVLGKLQSVIEMLLTRIIGPIVLGALKSSWVSCCFVCCICNFYLKLLLCLIILVL